MFPLRPAAAPRGPTAGNFKNIQKVTVMLPAQRKTRSQTKMGRSHDGLKAVQSVRCSNCGSPKRPHTACGECGFVRPGLKLELGKED